ncbi:MAG: MMPL family transporter [Mobilicoccus sp.]|nr:MMPL family transporter [Mobilicoccus sp.]
MSAPARAVSGRRSWITLLVLLAVCGAILGFVSNPSSTGAPNSLPQDAESALVEQELATFPDGDQAPAIAVATRRDGAPLTDADLAALLDARERMIAVERGVEVDTATDTQADAQGAPGQEGQQGAPAGGGQGGPPPVIPTDDRQIAQMLVPISTELSGADLAEVVGDVRDAARDGLPADLDLLVTGGPAFGADTAGAFEGADFRLLGVSAIVVAVLLLITYRSPILWIVPLIVVGLAERVATLLSAVALDAAGYVSDGSTGGITSVLVFGAGTNYALLIVSRYREELRHEPDHRLALGRAVQASAHAVFASNITVVLALATLLLATVPNTRILGLSAAVGLLVTVVVMLIGLPTVLALCGRRIFWPFTPKVGDEVGGTRGGWYRMASLVVARPLVSLAATVPLLIVCAFGLTHARIGLEQSEQFRVQAESIEGLNLIRASLPAGEVTPATVLATGAERDDVTEALDVLGGTPGVVEATPTGVSGDRVRYRVVLDAEPASEEAFTAVEELRSRVDVLDDALVGGADAEQLDSRTASEADLRLLVPLILGVVTALLFLLLRGAWAPLLLMAATSVSTLAAIGAGAWVSAEVFGFPALDIAVPLFAVLFLVALGVDYTIFLVLRAWEEARGQGTREGTVRAVSLTGGVITSAGVVLAAVFVVLGVLPLITLTQIGIIVGLGILLDTFVVRTIVVPSIISVMGDRFWWPRRPAASQEAGRSEPDTTLPEEVPQT